MSLRFGILGMLSKWEASGYDLKKEFDDVMSAFWHSHLSQIYPELNKLEKDELVKSRIINQEGKPDKKVYAITEEGKESLIQWLLTPPEPPKVKDPFLLQNFFKDNIAAEEVIFHLKIYKQEREKRLSEIKTLMRTRAESIKKRDAMKARIVMSFAVLKRGLEEEINYIKWCEDTIQLIESCRFLWEQDEQIHREYATNGKDSVEYTSSASYQDVEAMFKNYFGDLLDDE